MMITKQQIKILHTLLSRNNLMPEKRTIIHSFTDGRTESSRQMTSKEAYAMIDHLQKADPLQKMRRKVFALARKMGMALGETKADNKMNAAKINRFLLKRGTVKKKLDELNYVELKKVINQFEMMEKRTRNSSENKAIQDLLKDCNITV